MSISYHEKQFRGVVNYDDGDLTGEVLFKYREKNGAVWGTFEGSRILFGSLVAKKRGDNSLDMNWHYINVDCQCVHGQCHSTPELLPDGRLRLHETWKAIYPEPIEGISVIEEINQ